MESGFYFFVLFVFGLAFGSFLNVVALRARRWTRNPPAGGTQKNAEDSILSGRSRCMRCGTTLRWHELIPLLSFLFLRGKCRTCKEKISWQYPIVELLSGLIFLFSPLYFARFFGVGNLFFFRPELWGFYFFVFVWVVAFWLLLLMSVIDIRHYIIPDELNMMLGVFGVFLVGLKIFFFQAFAPFNLFFVKGYAFLLSLFPELVE
ncbi:MAG: prepilin peptidase, partial [bacterium]|nr:prepilin peptidase [bacterium]